MTETQDIVIIGGGPGGYVAAIHAARLGATVTLVEKADVGGTCLNWGCIPTKSLLASADILSHLSEAKDFGVSVQGYTFDLSQAMSRKDGVVRQLRSGVESLFVANGVRLVRGSGDIVAPGQVKVTNGQEEIISARNIVIATGSVPATLPIPGLDAEGVINSNQAVALKSLPKRLLIIGGGAIGVEFGDMFNRFGSQVTIVELMDRLIPMEDADLSQVLQRSFRRRSITQHLGSSVKEVRTEGGEKVVTVLQPKDKQQEVRADLVLVGVGRVPNTRGLSLDKIGIRVERGRIIVDERMRTSVPGIYAIGDVVGKMMLAHVASHEGMVAVENALGREATMDYKAVPRCIYTRPEIAGVGLTEAMAREQGRDLTVGRFPFSANGKALGIGERDGFVKVIADKEYGEILGIAIAGPHATELIAEAALAISMEGTVEDVAQAIHAHPTLSEVSMEAALDVNGQAIHIAPRKARSA
ncbi:MAG: dihydrolipoyl dehydrogenase [Chloroflexi bacterium]|nr:dihydrolipoyl dehydrogenase [Chloroflexota bacterium]